MNDWKICHTVICKVATLTAEVAEVSVVAEVAEVAVVVSVAGVSVVESVARQ